MKKSIYSIVAATMILSASAYAQANVHVGIGEESLFHTSMTIYNIGLGGKRI